jgi:CBS domain containing-hemolysin-like protein
MLPLYRLRDLVGIDLEDADVSTVGGYVTALLGRLPVQGDRLSMRNFLVTVLEADNRRVRQLRFSRRKPDAVEITQ